MNLGDPGVPVGHGGFGRAEEPLEGGDLGAGARAAALDQLLLGVLVKPPLQRVSRLRVS